VKQMGFAIAAAFALAFSAVPAAMQTATGTTARATGGDDVTLTGCVVKGDGGYVLTNIAEGTATAAVSVTTEEMDRKNREAGIAGPAQVIYWLKDDEELEAHAGQKVEVRGELEGDVEKGKISVEREQDMIDVEFKVEDEKKITVKLPPTNVPVGTAGTVGDREVDVPYVVRKIDVESVKMISSTCQ
jgi:hypothetical protein